MRNGERNRLVACLGCGNRVPREARRCPACGRRAPTREEADAPATGAGAREAPQREPDNVRTPRPATRPAVRKRRRALVLVLGALLVLTAAGVTAVYVTMPPTSPPLVHRPAPPVAEPPPPVAAEPAAPQPANEPARSLPEVSRPSRSRGRSDWLFFFKPGDWLARMADDALLGVVVRVEKTHTFDDGSRGPAYVVQSMEGDERVVDADELERTARLR
jgi:hypothetical protein